ncbi:MAG TPA: GyrI-like domain-containing protein [bacterium]|nr:GyrI-like domain-containing protein [bacterium]
MKSDWKKTDKALYLPGSDPRQVIVPPFQFFSIKGRGNPNGSHFMDCVGALYSVAYAVRMSYKSSNPPEGYFEYTVFPLEGVWDVSEEARYRAPHVLDKDQLVYTMMIRQPDFVTPEFARYAIEAVRKKRPGDILDSAEFGTYEEGLCVQMMHTGSYDSEAASFSRMHDYCAANSLVRKSMAHREIYISNPGSVAEAKLRTVLRFQAAPC